MFWWNIQSPSSWLKIKARNKTLLATSFQNFGELVLHYMPGVTSEKMVVSGLVFYVLGLIRLHSANSMISRVNLENCNDFLSHTFMLT
jgi:hypothetical protein